MSQVNRLTSCPNCNEGDLLQMDNERSICLSCGSVISPDLEPVKRHENQSQIDHSNPPRLDYDDWEKYVTVSGSTEKNIAKALSTITRLGAIFSVEPGLLDKSSKLYRRLILKKRLKRYRIDVIAAAVFYITCRNQGKPFSLADISEATQISKRELAKSYRLVVNALKINVPRRKPRQIKYPRTFTKRDQMLTLKIIGAASEKRLTVGRNTDAITAAACYITGIISGNRHTQRQLSELYRVTQTTIRNRYKEMEQKLSIRVIC